ncbi:MAG: hypothetical protein EXS29_07680 [Pedosphaera sp.]|nr:hypothetical protein [Pedosphaera sp.]
MSAYLLKVREPKAAGVPKHNAGGFRLFFIKKPRFRGFLASRVRLMKAVEGKKRLWGGKKAPD